MPKPTRAPRGARRLPDDDDESVAGSAVELVKNAEPPREKRQPRRTKERPGKALAAQDADELEAPEPDDAEVAPRRRRKRRREIKADAPHSCFGPCTCVVCGGICLVVAGAVILAVGAAAGSTPARSCRSYLVTENPSCGGAPSSTCLPPLAPVESLEDCEDAARMLTEADQHALRPLSWETYDRPDGIAGWPDWASSGSFPPKCHVRDTDRLESGEYSRMFWSV